MLPEVCAIPGDWDEQTTKKIVFTFDDFTSFTVSDLCGNTILPYFTIFYIWRIVEIKVIN